MSLEESAAKGRKSCEQNLEEEYFKSTMFTPCIEILDDIIAEKSPVDRKETELYKDASPSMDPVNISSAIDKHCTHKRSTDADKRSKDTTNRSEAVRNLVRKLSNEESLEKKREDYLKLVNIDALKVQQYDGELYENISEDNKQQDMDLQKVQQYMVAAMSATAMQAQTLIELKGLAENSNDLIENTHMLTKCYDSVMDANHLFTRAMYGTNQVREAIIRHGLPRSPTGDLSDTCVNDQQRTNDDGTVAANNVKTENNVQENPCSDYSTDSGAETDPVEVDAETNPHKITEYGMKLKTPSKLRTDTSEKPHKKCEIESKDHEEVKRHVCDICHMKFRTAINLKIHVKQHAGQELQECRKDFFTLPSDLEQHILSHKEERPHPCSECGKGFDQLSELNAHIVEHSEAESHVHRLRVVELEDKNSHSCEGFSQASDMNMHRKKVQAQVKQHLCSECGAKFKRKDTLEMHMRTHSQRQSHKCLTCGEACGTSEKLKSHMVTAHGDGFNQLDNIREHVQTTHTNKLFVCRDCGKICHDAGQLKTHMDTHSRRKPHGCTECDKLFTSKSSLKKHIMWVHSGEKSHVCSECGLACVTVHQLRRHLKTHSLEKSHVCTDCGRAFAFEGYLRTHMMTHTGERPHMCSVCGKGFIQPYGLQQHMLVHTGEKPHMCSVCGQRFAKPGTLKVHMMTHTGERPHTCKQCGQGFSRPSILQLHMRCHTGERPYICSQCEKAFRCKSTLNSHMLTHSSDKPHVCTQCNQAFNRKSYFETHMKRVHQGVHGSHVCSEPGCGKRFYTPSNLKIHMQSHTGLRPCVCPDCGKGLRDAVSLRTHMRTHTGERPYPCKDCTKAFNTSTALKTHRRTHTGEKPYMCPECGKGFSVNCNLKSHMKTHNG